MQEPLKKLKTVQAVKDELAAEEMFDRLYEVVPNATYAQRSKIVDYLQDIASQYSKTPTGKKKAANWPTQSTRGGHDQ